jgi:hypothetical protein
MAQWRKFFALPQTRRQMLVEAAVRLVFAWSCLRIVPFQRIVERLRPARRPAAAFGPQAVREIRWAVETAARVLPLDLACLPQGLAACWMLRARGGAPLLHYGVAATEGGGFESHVWVEVDGLPVVGHRAAEGFSLLTTFPTARGVRP